MQIVTESDGKWKAYIIGLLFLIGVLLTCPTKDDILEMDQPSHYVAVER